MDQKCQNWRFWRFWWYFQFRPDLYVISTTQSGRKSLAESHENWWNVWKWHFLTKFEVVDWQTWENHVKNWSKVSKMTILAFLAQKASKVIISLFSGFWDSSMKMRGQFLSKGGTQSWPGTAIVNHPLRHENRRGLSYFPYIFYFVNFTISAAIRQGLFGSFENVIKEFPNFCDFRKFFNFLRGFLTLRIDQKMSVLGCHFGSS